LLVSPQTKKIAVNGAWILALKTAAIPITIKLIGMICELKKVFSTNANNNPKNAPINKLGAKTPPSPPEAKVTDVTIGFKIKTPMNVKAKVNVNGILLSLLIMMLFIA